MEAPEFVRAIRPLIADGDRNRPKWMLACMPTNWQPKSANNCAGPSAPLRCRPISLDESDVLWTKDTYCSSGS